MPACLLKTFDEDKQQQQQYSLHLQLDQRWQPHHLQCHFASVHSRTRRSFISWDSRLQTFVRPLTTALFPCTSETYESTPVKSGRAPRPAELVLLTMGRSPACIRGGKTFEQRDESLLQAQTLQLLDGNGGAEERANLQRTGQIERARRQRAKKSQGQNK